MQIILLGAPGAGKGTQAQLLSDKLKIPKISTGDILRAEVAAETEIGREVKQTMALGQLVSDETILKLLKNRISQPDYRSGLILDGFPRNTIQAEALLKANIAIDFVILVDVPDDDIVARMGGRRIHASSGRVYHTVFNPPKVSGRDDVTGEPLIQREDDNEQTVRKRLQVYHKETEPLIEWYQSQPSVRLAKVFGLGSVEEIHNHILAKLSKTNIS